MYIYWIVIAGIYAILAFASWWFSRNPEERLKRIVGYMLPDGIDVFRELYNYFRIFKWVSIVGFSLAAFAASISSGFIKEISLILFALILFYVIFSTLNRRGKMTKSQSIVLASTLFFLAILLFIAFLPFCLDYIKGRPSIPPLPGPGYTRHLEDLWTFLLALGGVGILTGLGLFILKGKRKNNKGKEKKA